jgi:WD40 repeat protein
VSEASLSILDHTLIRPIGKGSFGQVWLARNVVGTYRAVKVVSRKAVDNEHDFQREFNGIKRFEPVSRLCPGLVNVLQIGRAPDESYFYYVMELGDDLEPRQEFAPADYQPRTLAAECRRRTRIPATEAALIGAHLAEALGFLHEQGLIHRDIKPSNVLFVRGQARIGDPGLVTAIEASHSLGGTLGYIAPEGAVTPKADLFSLGKLLYVISTAKQPGEYPLLPAAMTSYPDARDLQRLNLIILRACAYNPKERYASAQELRKDLLEVHAGRSPGETRKRLRLAKRIGVGLAVLLVVIAAGYYRTWAQAKAERGRLGRSYMETVVRLQAANDPVAALPFLGSVLAMARDNDAQSESAVRSVSFIWRYSPRLVSQWYFTNAINRVAFAPSGRQLALAGASGSVWLWTWDRQAPVLLGKHLQDETPVEVETVAISPDGKIVASGGQDGNVRWWSLTESFAPQTLSFSSAVMSVAFHPREPGRLAVGCANGEVVLVERTGQRRQLLPPNGTHIHSVAVSPDGTKLAAGDLNGVVHEWNLETAEPPRRQTLTWVYQLAYNPTGSLLAVAAGNRAHLEPFAPQAPARIRHTALVGSVSFDPRPGPGGDRLLTACFDNTVRLWSCAEDLEVMPPIPTDLPPKCAVFAPDGAHIAISTFSGLVRVYALPPSTSSPSRTPTAVSPDGSRYARVHEQTNVVLFDASSDRMVAQIQVEGPALSHIELDRNGAHLLTRQRETKQVRYQLWETANPRLVAATNLQGTSYGSLSPDGKYVAFRLTDKLWLWRPYLGTSSTWPWQLASPASDAELRFSEQSPHLAVAWSKNVLVVSMTGETVASWSFPHIAYTIDIDPKGERVVVGEKPPGLLPSTNYVWDVRTRAKLSPPMVLEDGTFLARFSSSGSRVILADEKDACLLVDTKNWSMLRLRGQAGIVTDAAFSHDEHLVATVTGNRGGAFPNVRIWETSSGTALTPALLPEFPEFGRLRFLDKDRSLCWFTVKGDWRTWDLKKLEAPASALTELTHLLSCRQMTATGESESLNSAHLNELWEKLHLSYAPWFEGAASGTNMENARLR